MRKRLLTGLLAGGMLTAMATGPAVAFSNGGGNSENAPGQENAMANCETNYLKQDLDLGLGDRNKNKDDKGYGPTNCDHYWTEPAPA